MTDSRPPATTSAWSRVRPIIHAVVVVVGFSVLFGWVYGRALFSDVYLIESDLYEYFLPIFLSPITQWSGFEFSGLPAFADPGDNVRYPLHFFFARIVGSWAGFITS